MSYGTPKNLDDVEAYYTHIRRGNPPAPEQLKELKDRYEAIVGGVFPLRENTDRQVEEFQAELNRQQPDDADLLGDQRLEVGVDDVQLGDPTLALALDNVAAEALDTLFVTFNDLIVNGNIVTGFKSREFSFGGQLLVNKCYSVHDDRF